MDYAIALRDDLPDSIKPLLVKISTVLPMGGRAIFSTTREVNGSFIKCTTKSPGADEPLVIDLPIVYVTAILEITDDSRKIGFI